MTKASTYHMRRITTTLFLRLTPLGQLGAPLLALLMCPQDPHPLSHQHQHLRQGGQEKLLSLRHPESRRHLQKGLGRLPNRHLPPVDLQHEEGV